jgi:hypothetical protein
VHPLLSALLCSFRLLTHLLYQAASLWGGRIALHIVCACHLTGWGRLCLLRWQLMTFVSFAVTSTMTNVKKNKQTNKQTLIRHKHSNYLRIMTKLHLTVLVGNSDYKQCVSKPHS